MAPSGMDRPGIITHRLLHSPLCQLEGWWHLVTHGDDMENAAGCSKVSNNGHQHPGFNFHFRPWQNNRAYANLPALTIKQNKTKPTTEIGKIYETLANRTAASTVLLERRETGEIGPRIASASSEPQHGDGPWWSPAVSLS